MSLPVKQPPLFIPLGPGLATEVDDKLLPLGKVVQVENGVWTREGEIVQRPGGDAIGGNAATAAGPVAMPVPWQLATHKGALVSLSAAGPRPIGVYSPGQNKWIAPAGTSNNDAINGVSSKLRGQVLPQRKQVYRSDVGGATFPGSVSTYGTDIATDGTYALVSWVQNNDAAVTTSLQARIVELATGKILFTFSTSLAHGIASTSARAVFVNSQLQLVWIDGANVKLVIWTIANLTAGTGAPTAPIALASDAGTGKFDAIASGANLLVVYGAAAQTNMIKRDSVGTVTSVQITTAAAATIVPGNVAWVSDLSASGKLALVVSSATTQGTRVHWDINAAGLPALSYTIDGAAMSQVVTAHTISSNSTGEFIVLYYDSITPAGIKIGRRTVASGISTQSWIFSATLGSKTFVHGVDFYALIAYESTTQGTLFAVRVPTNPADATDITRTPSARLCTGQSSPPARNTPPSFAVLSTDVVLSVAAIRAHLEIVAGVQSFDVGVDTIKLAFNPTVGPPREFADSLYVAGGILGAFDGETFAEEGFHLAPEAPVVANRAGGSMTLLGTYYYSLVFRYTDDFGRLRRSAPSPTTVFALTGANQSATVTCKTLKLNGRPGRVVLELYRSLNGASSLQQLVSVAANDETVDTATIVDTTSDVSLGSSEVIYTSGGVQPNEPAPVALAVASYKDRLAIISAEDPTLIWISFPLVPGQGPRFSTTSTIRIDDARGDLVSAAAIDDKLVAFKADAVYAIFGDGPSVLGTDGTFGLAQLIAAGVGCSQPRTIVQTLDAVCFRSSSTRAGYYSIGRGLSLDYIGKDVQSYLTGISPMTIVDAVHVPELSRTELFTGQSTLVYDHVLKLWTTYTGQAALAATVWGGRHVYHQAGQTALSLVAESSSNEENGLEIQLYVLTPWLSLAGLKGFSRFYQSQGLGQTVGAHLLTLTMYTDFNGPAVGGAPLVTKTKSMGNGDDWNAWDMKYPTKKTSFQFGIRCSSSGDADSAKAKISGMSILWAAKAGMRKTSDGNRLT